VELLIGCARSQDLIGEAAPAVEGDELDVTISNQPKPIVPELQSEKQQVKEETEKVKEKVVASLNANGLSLYVKMFLLVVIVGVCYAFVKTRAQSSSYQYKSMA